MIALPLPWGGGRGEGVWNDSKAQSYISRICEENVWSYEGRALALGDSESLIVKGFQMESLRMMKKGFLYQTGVWLNDPKGPFQSEML